MPLINPFKPFQKNKENKDSSAAGSLSSSSSVSGVGSNELKIGTPTNFKHNIQVKYDKERNEYVGLPNEWRALLEKNNIK